MCEETIDFLATAPCGDALPTLRGAELERGLEIVAIVRTQDQIRIRCRRRSLACVALARTAARSLAARALHPER